MVESPLGVAGIRGTQFGMSVDSKSTELAVLEGKVGFKDANQQTENVETAQKVVGAEGGASDVDALPETKKIELANAVADSKKLPPSMILHGLQIPLKDMHLSQITLLSLP